MPSSLFPEMIQGRYRYLADLGEGGMGRVVKVEDLSEGVVRALKWVDISQPITATELRHHREFQILAQFRHPHVLRVYHYGVCPDLGGRFFTCDCLEGPPLSDVLDRLTPDVRLRSLIQLLRALSLIHAQGWVHGDIKPENLLLRRPLGDVDPDFCLVDFGLAHPTLRPPEEKILGTVYYIPPERILGARMDARGDLYSVGVLAYRYFTGRLPFSAPDKMTVLQGHLRVAPEPPSRFCEIQPGIEQLILSLLAKRPSDRPASSEEVLHALHRELGEPEAPETPRTLRAYLHAGDECGWEDPLGVVLGGVMRRAGAASRELDVAPPTAGPVGNTETTMPLLPRERGSSRTGLVLVRGSHAGDVEQFRDLAQRRIEGLGLPIVTISAARTRAPLVDLVTGVLGHLGSDALRQEPVRRWNQQLARTQPAELVIRSLVHWLAAVATLRPWVFILDEIEQSGPAICRLLTCLAERERESPALRNVTWIAFQRAAPGLTAAQWLQSEPAKVWQQDLVLRSLDPETLARWLERRLPGAELCYPLKSLLSEESEGSPWLLQKVLRSLVQGGIIGKGWDGWVESPQAAALTCSPLVEEALVRFNTTPLDDRKVLGGLAAAGGTADLDWIRRITELGSRELLDSITRLRADGWISQEVGGQRFRFASAYFKKAVRLAVGERNWRLHNETMVRLLLQRANSKFGVRPDRLAQHLVEAGRVEEALPHARSAAREALAERRDLDAIRWLDMLLRSGSLTVVERVEFLDQLAELRQEWGPSADVELLRRQAVATSEEGNDSPAVRVALQEKLARSEGLRGDFALAFQRLNDALQMFPREDRASRCRRLFLLVIELNLFRGTAAELDEVWRLVQDYPADLPTALAGQQALLGAEYRLARGQRRPGLDEIRKGLGLLDACPTTLAAAWSNLLLARHHELSGFGPEAIGLYRLAAYLFRREGDALQTGRCLLRLGEHLFRRGDASDAEDCLRKADALFARVGAVVEQPRVAWVRGLLLARSGWVAEAAQQFTVCHAWSRRYPATQWGWECTLAEAEIDTCRGRLAEAAAILAKDAHPSQAPHRDNPDPWVRWAAVAQAHALKSGQPGRALQLNMEALQEVRERGDVAHQVPLWWARWRLLGQLGCQNEANQLRQRMLALGERYPELAPHVARNPHEVSESDLLRSQDEEEIARHYYEKAKSLLVAEEWTRAVFLFEEAEFHAKRVRAQPLTTLISARLATVRHRVFAADEKDTESTLQRGWKTLESRGIVLGRAELFTMWSHERESEGDPAGAAQFRVAAAQLLDAWSARIPLPHERDLLGDWLGLDRGVSAPSTRDRVTP